MSKNKTRKSLAQIKMVQQGYLTMYGYKDKLCLDAEVTLVTSRHPKMLAAYTHKLHPLAEKSSAPKPRNYCGKCITPA